MKRPRWTPYEEEDNQQWLARVHEAYFRESRLDLRADIDLRTGHTPEYTTGVGGHTPFFSIKEDIFHGRHLEPRRSTA